jgi:hypothetical protein
MMRTKVTLVSAGVLLLTMGALASPAHAATSVVADWRMNEPAGATTMTDSSGNNIVGAIGSEVITGVSVDGAVGYRFPRLTPSTPPAHPEHNVLVVHDDRVQPAGRAEFVVEARIRTGNKFGNLVQKGQATARGGYWKIQLPKAEPSCLFRGPSGVTNAIRALGRPINDNRWHVIRCEATPTEARLYLDGVFIGRNRGTTGPVANTELLSIGGKYNCDQVNVTCDYFGGDVDYVRIERSDT